MGRLLRLLMLLLLATATCASAAAVRLGDRVRFVERDQHILAHPAPGDTRVHLRFVRGSEVTVLRVDTAHYSSQLISIREYHASSSNDYPPKILY